MAEVFISFRKPVFLLQEKYFFRLILSCLTIAFLSTISFSQTTYFTPGTSSSGYLNSSLFRQEIVRFEINVVRSGKAPLPITEVPRVQKDDVLKIKLLDEAVGGIKLDQSQWNWTLLVAFINPNHRMSEKKNGEDLKDSAASVSEEVNFRKQGWYREYSFTVPYDSQPVFFLYPKPQYRKQLVRVVNSKYEEIRKLGEKTIEIAGAYAQISSFLNELQMVLNRNAQLYGYTYNGNTATNNPYNPYNPYYPYTPAPATPPEVPILGLNTIPALNQVVEGLARSFNIQLPSCWGNTNPVSNYGNYTGSYSSGYNSGYGSSTSSTGTTADFVSRAQCVAKNVNLQDFDVSVMRMWQQGGVFLAAELQKKYPQLAYWINIAAVAIDFIVKAFQKSPLRIVPSVIQSSDNQSNGSNQNYSSYSNYSSPTGANPNGQPAPVKISLFAESQPSEGQYVTAYPIVVHKWQANPDPDVISLYPPVLSEPCLHSGQNILKNTDLSAAWSEDTYSRDFKLVMSSANGFRKEFPLRKNIGLGGWELNITPEDMNQIPKINMTLESEIIGTRGFNEIKSPKFDLPLSVGGSWELTPESQRDFSVGGKRTITLRNSLGSCRCLQRVIYKPSFGGQFVFEAGNQNSPNALQYSADGRQVSFEVDATNFQPGAGTLEIKTYGGDQPQQQIQMNQQQSNIINLKLYAAPPIITDVKARRGDREILITGERLEQIQAINISGRRALIRGNNINNQGSSNNSGQNTFNQNQSGTFQKPNQNQGYSNQAGTVSAPVPNSTVANTPSGPQSPIPGQYQNISSNQRVAVFDNAAAKIDKDSIALDLTLEDNRSYQVKDRFPVGLSRPSIKADEINEIEGVFLKDEIKVDPLNNNPSQNATALSPPNSSPLLSQLNKYPVAAIDKAAMTVTLQNILTDYSFKLENLSIETRIENAAATLTALPQIKLDVLDTNNIRLNFIFNQETNKYLAGRRLQFRIHDRERSDSDWYTIKQTFVRIPAIESVKCTNEMNGQCEIKGTGLDYIAQVSVDGGKSWFPQAPNTLQVQPAENGQTMMLIPELINKAELQIKLRDYPKTDGLSITNFVFLNTIKKTVVKPAKLTEQIQKVNPSNENPPPTSNQPTNQMPNGSPNQTNQVNQNQPSSPNNKKPNKRIVGKPTGEKPKSQSKP